MANNLKTLLLLSGMTIFLVLVGGVLRGAQGAIIALMIAAFMNFFSYFFSDKMALLSSGAKPVSREQLPRIYEIVERLCAKTGLPMPKIYVIPTDSPNAFATGRNPQHSSVAVTHGILQLLTDEEMEGVLAHELGHVRNRDILISSVAATLAGAITLLARMVYYGELFGGFGGGRDRDRDGGGVFTALAMMILAPFAALLIQMAISRSREFEADATGARFTGNPYALASALQKIDATSRRLPMQATPSTAHLYIMKPWMGMGFGSLFSTHPPTAERIARLTGMPPQGF